MEISLPKLVFLWFRDLKNQKTGPVVQSFPVLVQSSCSLFAVLRLDFQALTRNNVLNLNNNVNEIFVANKLKLQLAIGGMWFFDPSSMQPQTNHKNIGET